MTGDRLLLARIGTERFAFALAEVIEAVDAPRVESVALAPAAMVGQCVHRGRLLPVLDGGTLLGVARAGGAGALLVFACEGDHVGVLVDDVLDAEVAHPSMRRPVPATGAPGSGHLAALLALPSGLAAQVDLGVLRATILSRLASAVG
jgi:chemotaxis signal transduction protein